MAYHLVQIGSNNYNNLMLISCKFTFIYDQEKAKYTSAKLTVFIAILK